MALFKKTAAQEPDYVTAKRREVSAALERIFGQVELDDAGDFIFTEQTAFGWGNVADWGDGDTYFYVTAMVLLDVPLSLDLYRYAATEWFTFGSMSVLEADDGRTGSLMFRDSILATDLDDSELQLLVIAVLMTAVNAGPELRSRFGGQLSRD